MIPTIRSEHLPDDALPQRLWWVAQYFRVTGLFAGFTTVVVSVVAFVTPLPMLQAFRDRPWALALAVCSAVSWYYLGEQLLRRQRLAALVAFVLLMLPLFAALAGRSTRPWTLAVSAASALVLASVWRILR